MKKFISIVLIISLLCIGAISVSAAKIGDIVNATVYTDIVAKINGNDIASYNVDGYTVVVAEDLRGYGFDVVWNDADRTLRISKNVAKPSITSNYVAPKIQTNKIGEKAFDVLYSDIKTYIDGQLVTSYNIDGRTVIYFNDLSCFGNVSYDDGTRTLSGQFEWRGDFEEVGDSSASEAATNKELTVKDIEIKVVSITQTQNNIQDVVSVQVDFKNCTGNVITFGNITVNDKPSVFFGGYANPYTIRTVTLNNWPLGNPMDLGDNSTGSAVVVWNGKEYYAEFNTSGIYKFYKIG